MEGPRSHRNARGVRLTGALESPGLCGDGVGDQRGHHQRDGRFDRHRAPVWRDRRPSRHDALERDAPPRCPVRSDFRVRAGRDGIRHSPGTPVVAATAPAITAPAVTWEVTDGIATVVLDLKGDRKSTRLNSSHLVISYAVFCLKKKKKDHIITNFMSKTCINLSLLF